MCLLLFCCISFSYHKWTISDDIGYYWSAVAVFPVAMACVFSIIYCRYKCSVFRTPDKVTSEEVAHEYQKTKTAWYFGNASPVPLREAFLPRDKEGRPVLYLWPNLECIEMCRDISIFKGLEPNCVGTIELLAFLHELIEQYGDTLYISLYSYPESGPLFTHHASDTIVGFAYDFFGREISDHYIRFLKHMVFCGNPEEDIADAVRKTEKKKTLLSKFLYY